MQPKSDRLKFETVESSQGSWIPILKYNQDNVVVSLILKIRVGYILVRLKNV